MTTSLRTSLLGLAVGDAFGECYFFPSQTAVARIQSRALSPPRWRYTDDTAQAAVLAHHLEALGRVDPDQLSRAFAAEYTADPRRGYGANAHDLLTRMARGEPWQEVAPDCFMGTGSMGNGAAMRVAPLGAFFARDLDRVAAEARASACVTHANPNGIEGAVAIALVAAHFARGDTDPDAVWQSVLTRTEDTHTRDQLDAAARIAPSAPVQEVVKAVGSGQRVCAHDTVPFAIWCALRHPHDYEEALWTTVSGLGDRDTTCAMVGGILGAAGLAPPALWVAHFEGLPPAQPAT